MVTREDAAHMLEPMYVLPGPADDPRSIFPAEASIRRHTWGRDAGRVTTKVRVGAEQETAG